MSILSKTTAPTSTEVTTTETRTADDALLARIEEIQALVESGDIKLDDMRLHYSSTYGKDTTLDDDDIVMIIAQSDDDHDAKGWAGLMREAEKSASNEAMELTTETAQDVMTVAHNLGGKLANEKFVGSMRSINAASELAKRGDAIIYVKLTSMWNADDWSRVPRPGTKKGETGNEPFDKWTVKDHANEGKVIKYSFFEEVAKSIPYYQEIAEELGDVSDVLKKDPELGNARREEMRRTWTKPKQQAYKATLSQRKTKVIGTIKKACALKAQYDRIASLPGIKCQLLMEKQPDGTMEVMATTSPIEVSHADKPSICTTYTTTTFLKLKPDAAMMAAKGEPDAMYGALDATLTRAPKSPKAGSGAASKYPTVDTPEDFDSCLASLSHFVDQKDNLLKLNKWFKDGKSDEVNQKVQAFGDAYLPLQSVWIKLRPVYEELQSREAQADERAARAGLQKTG